MAYYLSEENDKFLQPFLRILKKTSGEVQLDTQSPDRLIYILRNGQVKYPEIKDWIFKKKLNHVLAIPRNPNLVTTLVNDSYQDYISLVSILINDKPESVEFTNAYLTDSEFNKLITTCEKLEYKIIRSPTSIKISR